MALMESFELTVEQLRARRSRKWSFYPADVLPAWIADMDFAVPDVVQQAVVQIVEQRDYGYGDRVGDEGLAAAFSDRMAERFGWRPAPAQVQPITELIQAMYLSVSAFSEPGDGVVIQTPIYPPYLETVAQTGRRLDDNPLRDDGSRFVLDVEGLRKVIDGQTRVLMLCHPHNPTGRVFERAELEALAELAIERDLLVLSDEIHADMLYDDRQFIPFASLSPAAAARTITLTSATKSFNIPGLRCALMHFGSPELAQRFYARYPERMLGQVSVPGLDATVAAWRQGQPWLDRVMKRLRQNRDRLAEFVREELPGVKHYTPEGTYLGWLDFSALELPQRPVEFFLERGRLALHDGLQFGERHGQCVRLNFGTSEAILGQVLERMATAVKGAAVAG
jgi:cysteine-S-conjugate beta-lyase